VRRLHEIPWGEEERRERGPLKQEAIQGNRSTTEVKKRSSVDRNVMAGDNTTAPHPEESVRRAGEMRSADLTLCES
jgi:hypothetical protein